MIFVKKFYQQYARFVVRRKQMICHSSSTLSKTPELGLVKPAEQAPGPKALPLIGCVHKFLPKFGEFDATRPVLSDQRLREKYGNFVRIPFFPGFVEYRVFDPKDVQTIFQNEGKYPRRPHIMGFKRCRESRGLCPGMANVDGQEWHKLRGSVQKVMLRPSNALQYAHFHNEVGQDFVKFIHRKKDSKGELPNIEFELSRWSTEAIGVLCFDWRLGLLAKDELDSHAGRILSVKDDLMDSFMKTTVFWLFHKNEKTRTWRKLCRDADIVYEASSKLVDEAVQRAEAGEKTLIPKESSVLLNLLKNPDLSKKEVLAVVTDILFGGVDTTANALGWTLYQLAKHQDEQQVLFREIIKNMPTTMTEVNGRVLNDMGYLKGCIQETLRLTLVTGGSARILDKELVLSGYRVPSNSYVRYSMHQAGLSEEHGFKHPTKFMPERWIRSNEKNKFNKFATSNFGHGARMCIGKRFAEQEICFALINIIRDFKLEYHYEDIGVRNRLLGIPDKPLRIKFVNRQETGAAHAI